MTKQEAIPTVNANKEDALNYFRNHCMVCKSSNECCNCDIGVAIECIEKQIPKKSNIDFFEEDGYRRKDRHCPNCGSYLGGYMICFCNNCGQAIDWSDNE